jgi:hypothetical protein
MLDKYPPSAPIPITRQVTAFARELTGRDDLCRVPIRPQSFANPLQCYLNSHLTTQFYGGSLVVGYSIWTTNDLFLTAEQHCIVQQPDGSLIDPTPDFTGASSLLFAVKEHVADIDILKTVVQESPSGAYHVLTEHPHIHRAVQILGGASHRMWCLNNHAMQTGEDVPDCEQRLWSDSMSEVESCIDKYYEQQARKVTNECRNERRKRRKKERQAKKRGKRQ